MTQSRDIMYSLCFSFSVAYLMFYSGLRVTKVLFDDPDVQVGRQIEYLFEMRHKYTATYLPIGGDKFRFVTYNILTDAFVSSDIAQKMFSYCPKYALAKEYRRPLILKELLGYHGDFLSLQECEEDMFKVLSHKFESQGYRGVFMKKHRGPPEGEALFYRTERYRSVREFSITVRDAIKHTSNKQLRSNLPKGIYDIILNRKALGLIHVFRNKIDHKLKDICIVNTHLYYAHDASHIRLLQLAILLNYLNANIIKTQVDVIVAGDLNSPISEPVIHYLSGKTIDRNYSEWKKIGKQNIVPSFKFLTMSGVPAFTIYSPAENGIYDHVFGSPGLMTLSSAPIPTIEEIKPYTGIPSVAYPSDHFALVLDILQKNER